jgi:hypothetical protein
MKLMYLNGGQHDDGCKMGMTCHFWQPWLLPIEQHLYYYEMQTSQFPNLKYLIIIATSINSSTVPTALSSSHFLLILLQLHWTFLQITKGLWGRTILFQKPCFQTTMKFAISCIFSSCFIFLVKTTKKIQKHQILD